MPAARQRGRSWSHDSGRYKSASSRAWDCPLATPTWTVTMPLSSLPTQPRYCRCTPGGLIAPLAAARLVDHPDRAGGVGGRRRDHRPQVPLEGVACPLVVPTGGDQELLEGTDGRAGFEGDGLDRLAG